MAACSEHPLKPAKYVCESCRRGLCDACVEVGKSLFFCNHCGERALPTEHQQTARPQELQRAAARKAEVSLPAALAFPLRGSGILALAVASAVSLVSVFTWLYAIGCLPRAGAILFLMVTALLLSSQSFTIVRETSEGDDDMPEWPDFAILSHRFQDLFGFVLSLLVVGLPALGLLGTVDPFEPSPVALALTEPQEETAVKALEKNADFTDFAEAMAKDEMARRTAPTPNFAELEREALEARKRYVWPKAIGLMIGVLLFLPAFGATAAYGSAWLTLRFDLHLQSLSITGLDGLRTSGTIASLVALQGLLEAMTIDQPALGVTVSVVASLYVLFAASHLVGLLFRRHYDALERLYLGTSGQRASR